MKTFKSEDIRYYCNACGELHEHGDRMLSETEELPLPLQEPYDIYWNDCLNVNCYIAMLNGVSGLLLSALHDDEFLFDKGIPNDVDAQLKAVAEYSKQVEKLVAEVMPEAAVSVGDEDPDGVELLLFIPTEGTAPSTIAKLFYIMNKYGYDGAPDFIEWEKVDMMAFLNQTGLRPETVELMVKSEQETFGGDLASFTDTFVETPAKFGEDVDEGAALACTTELRAKSEQEIFGGDLVSFEGTFVETPAEFGEDVDEGAALACTTIDGYPADENTPGRVVCRVWNTGRGFIVDWHENGYRMHPTVLELIKESKHQMGAISGVESA